jgi:hypothetical protein
MNSSRQPALIASVFNAGSCRSRYQNPINDFNAYT